MKNICIIVNKYPNAVEPNALVFVQQMVWSMADQGLECSVICPLPVNLNPKYAKFPFVRTENTEHGNVVTIYHPKYIGFGQARKVFGVNPAPLTTSIFSKAVIRTIGKLKVKPNVLYGHFLVPAGIATARAGRVFDIPAFVAYGEATDKTIKEFGADKLVSELGTLAGIVSVSTENKDRLLSYGVADEQRIAVFPNGYRSERFYPRDKITSRKMFGFPEDAFIVGMVGSFDERKGVLRLQQAVDELEGVLFACAGKGSSMPQSGKCIHKTPVNNEEIPYFLSALDAFVLPTQHEGCSNAIVEAMATGLPIISSDRPFNYDVCDAANAVLIDPDDIAEIKKGVALLRDNTALRWQLASGSLKKSEKLTLKERAEGIVNYISSEKG